VANWDSGRLDFYRSNGDDLFATTTCFALVGSWQFSPNGLGAGSIDGRWGVYENINLFADEDGSLWFVGMETVFLRPDISIEPIKVSREVLKSGTDVLTLEPDMLQSGTDLLIPGFDFLISDWADLYQLSVAATGITVTKRASKRFYRSGAGPRFRYGSGFRLNSVTGKLEVYSCEANLSNLGRVNRCNRWG
jgi:hypothetical protein